MDSLLHLRGTPAANWNLLLQVAMGAALLVGMGLARRRPPAEDQEAVVRLTNFKFTPDKVTVAAGATVTWLDDTGRHSVRCDEEAFQSEPLVSGQRFAHRFDRPGTYQVYCGVHGRNVMAGTVAVVPR